MNQEPQRTQEFTLNGDEVVAKVKEIPLTLGLIGAALLPVFAAIGAAAALATRCTVVVERDTDPPVSS